MATFNTVTVLGNITADPDLKYTSNGKAVCRFDIAVGATATADKKNVKTSFFTVEVWDKKAELLCEWSKKGRLLLIGGRLRQDSWTDQNDKKQYKVLIVANTIQFLGKGKKDEEAESPSKKQSNDVSNNKDNPPVEDPSFSDIPEEAEQF